MKTMAVLRVGFRPTVDSRLVLLAGFGGLLILMAFAGVDGIQALQQIQTSNDHIRDEFLLRTQVLERIRSDLYLSGTDVRDYLLEPQAGKADGHRYTLLETRKDMDAALQQYLQLLSRGQAQPFRVLTEQLAAYWSVLEPTFEWTAEQRQRAGYAFLRDEVFPRRTSMLAIADQIGRLNEAQLNSGKVAVQGAFRQFQSRLMITIGLTIALGFVLAIFSTRKILKLESTSAQHYTEISHARVELKQLSARLLEAQEEERRLISRELHDEVGQALTGVLLEMANLSNLIRNREESALSKKVDEIKRLLEVSIGVVRNMALLLRPSMLDDLGLVPALQWQAREASKRSGLWVKVAAEEVSDELTEDHKTCIYRIVQEALHNIVQHANARNVRITVSQEPDRLLLSIQDDGRGFNPPQERGMGLIGMEERVSALGGRLVVESASGEGTLLRVALPLPQAVTANG
ncbi:MAG: ATP-binding protein [Candidatus Solibacter sp.]|jgi:signal transduction histidine kinase